MARVFGLMLLLAGEPFSPDESKPDASTECADEVYGVASSDWGREHRGWTMKQVREFWELVGYLPEKTYKDKCGVDADTAKRLGIPQVAPFPCYRMEYLLPPPPQCKKLVKSQFVFKFYSRQWRLMVGFI